MVVTAVTGALFPVSNHSPQSRASASGKLGGISLPKSIQYAVRGVKSAYGSLQVKANSPNVNGSKVPNIEGLKTKDNEASLALFGLGKLMQDGFVFRQSFSIRSYEVGPDRSASIESMLNHLQETALNHAKSVGFMDGHGSSPEMSKRNLIWVVTKMQVSVDRFPSWGDVVQIDSWGAASGKNGMRRDWIVRDSYAKDILMRASNLFVMMNKETRKLSKMQDQIRTEMKVVFEDLPLVLDGDSRKLPKLDETTADDIRTGLTSKWSDLDVNQHVNNVKYVGWILESVPIQILEGYKLTGMTLEYRRECSFESMLQSLTSVLHNGVGDVSNSGKVECQHLLRLESGEDIVKGRTEWMRKLVKSTGNFPVGSA